MRLVTSYPVVSLPQGYERWPSVTSTVSLPKAYPRRANKVSVLQGDANKAINYFERAVSLSSTRNDAYQFLGAVFFPQRKYAEAAMYFAQAVRYDPYETEARFYLATCWMILGKCRQAAREFRAARQVEPDDWQVYKAEARALADAGERQEAARVLKTLAGWISSETHRGHHHSVPRRSLLRRLSFPSIQDSIRAEAVRKGRGPDLLRRTKEKWHARFLLCPPTI